MNSFGILDVVLFLGIGQGLFLSFSLYFIQNKNRQSNHVLSLLLLMAAFIALGRVMVFKVNTEMVWRIAMFGDSMVFLFGPLFYLYIKRLLFGNGKSFRLSWKHYFLAGVHLSYVIFTLFFSSENFAKWYEMGILKWVWAVIELGGILSLSYYIFRTYQLWKNYRIRKPEELSNWQGVDGYISVFLGILSLFVALWAISSINYYVFEEYWEVLNYNSMWICIPLMMYVVGYFSLRQPEIFKMSLPRQTPNSSALKLSVETQERNRLKPNEIAQLQKRLHFFMNQEKVFLQPDITLNTLSARLNTTPNNLSWLLNQVYQKKFYDYINAARVEAFKSKINAGAHRNHTLLALAMDVGFNSKSTFNKVFKAQMGMTPSAYVQQKNVA